MTRLLSPDETPTIRVLLWAPKGAGLHYHGPGSFAYRMYSSAESGKFDLTLAHGYPDQPVHELFAAQTLIASCDSRPLAQWSFIARGCKWVLKNRESFDVFHGLMGYHSTVRVAYEAERHGLPSVVFLANHNAELRDKGGWRRVLGLPRRRRRMVRQISALVAMSKAIYDELLDYGVEEDRIARIPMGVDVDRFVPVGSDGEQASIREGLGIPNIPTIGFVGEISRRKQPHLLIDALSRVRRKDIDCQIVLVGPFPDRSYADSIRRLVAELGLTEQVLFMGFSERIAEIFRAFDIFALVSEREGMPASLVEAMASGLPVIVSPVSGAVDLVQHSVNGFFVGSSGAEIAQAVTKYMNDPSLRLDHGAASRKLVVDKYSTHVVSEAYYRVFQAVMRGTSPADAAILNE